MKQPYATKEDITELFRPLSSEEEQRAEALLPAVSDLLRQYAKNVGKDLDEMIDKEKVLPDVVKAVTVDVVARALMTSTTDEPMSQMSQSALGYSMSGTYLVPGGGLFVKNAELKRLGLLQQRLGVIDLA